MAEIGGLQLLPETRKKIELQIPGENRYLYSGIALLSLVLAIFAAVYLYNRSLEEQMASYDNRLSGLESKRNKSDEQDLLAFSKQAGLMTTALANHIFWTQALAKISSLTQNQVQVKSLSASVDKKEVILTANAANYSTIARQVASFISDDSIADVNVGEMKTQTSGRLEFTLQLQYSPAKLLQKK